MANQLYSLIYITVNGRLLTEEFSASMSRSSNSNAVMTVAKGYSGEAPGAAMAEVDISNAVPAAGFEFNAQDYIEGLVPVEVGVQMGSQRAIVKGFIISDSMKHSVNSESNYEFKMRGPFARFE